MRALVLSLSALMLACAPAPPPPAQAQNVAQPPPDLTVQPWYARSTDELVASNRQAADLIQAGQFQQASGVVGQAQPLEDRLLTASHPTLGAMQAASDHDDLAGRLYLHDQRWGWARMTYQKILVRWKAWKPQTPDTARRIKEAADAVADCDKHL